MAATDAARPLRWIQLMGDVLMLLMAFGGGYALKFYWLGDTTEGNYAVLAVAFALAWVAAAFLGNGYWVGRLTDVLGALRELLQRLLLHLLIVAAFVTLSRGYLYSREQLLFAYVLAAALLALWRLGFIQWLRGRHRRGISQQAVAIWGQGSAAGELAQFFQLHPETGYALAAHFVTSGAEPLPQVACYPATPEALAEAAPHFSLRELYVTLPGPTDNELSELAELADRLLLRLHLVPDFGTLGLRNLQLELYDGLPVVAVQHRPLDQWTNRALKRSFDLVVSVVFLVFVASWLFPILALLVRLSSPGPVLFKQVRTGLDGRDFACYKFRSMRPSAEADLRQASRSDERITPIGRFLRRTNLDELPQFWNVLVGQMSVVGPRPHMVKHTEQYSQLIDKYMMRHAVKPGITGLAQARGFRGETPTVWHMKSRVAFDRFYVDHWSLGLDLRILFDTVWLMIRGDEQAV